MHYLRPGCAPESAITAVTTPASWGLGFRGQGKKYLQGHCRVSGVVPNDRADGSLAKSASLKTIQRPLNHVEA